MDVVRIVTPLARLLKEKDVFMSFINNTRNNGFFITSPHDINAIDIYNLIWCIIDWSFTWSYAKEGHGIWSGIHHQWRDKFFRLSVDDKEKYVEEIINTAKKKYNAIEATSPWS